MPDVSPRTTQPTTVPLPKETPQEKQFTQETPRVPKEHMKQQSETQQKKAKHGKTSSDSCTHPCETGECHREPALKGSDVEVCKESHHNHTVCELLKESADILLHHQKLIHSGDMVDVAFPLKRVKDGQIEHVLLTDFIPNKRVILFGHPSAMTDISTTRHVPEWVEEFQAFRDMGVDHVLCVNTNNPFINDSWLRQLGMLEDEIMWLSDPDMGFIMSLGLLQYAPGLGICSRRFSMLLDNGRVVILNVDHPGMTSYEVTSPSHMRKKINELANQSRNRGQSSKGSQQQQQQQQQQQLPQQSEQEQRIPTQQKQKEFTKETRAAYSTM